MYIRSTEKANPLLGDRHNLQCCSLIIYEGFSKVRMFKPQEVFSRTSTHESAAAVHHKQSDAEYMQGKSNTIKIFSHDLAAQPGLVASAYE